MDKVISFVERQQNIKREIKRQEKIKQEKQDEENKLFWKKYWWIIILIFVSVFSFLMIMSIIENEGVVGTYKLLFDS